MTPFMTWPPMTTWRPSGRATTVGYQRGVCIDAADDHWLVDQS